MSRVAFKQREVELLLRAAINCGYPHPIVDKLPDGRLRLLTAPQPATPVSTDDGDLDAELADWTRKHGYG